MANSVITYTNTYVWDHQANRSGENFSTTGISHNYLKWRCRTGLHFRIMQDKSVAKDPVIFEDIYDGCITSNPRIEKLYTANPRLEPYEGCCEKVTVEGIDSPDNNSDNRKLDNIELSDWMSGLPDSRSLSDLSIPGTHDSGTAKIPAGIAHCQNFDIYRQLQDGIRFLDIRLSIIAGTLRISHGVIDCGITFSDVINWCKTFLREHPGETILMSVKHEAGLGDISNLFAPFLQQEDYYYKGNKIPTLGDVRGKVVFFFRFIPTFTGRYAGIAPDKIGIVFERGWNDNATFRINSLAGDPFHIEDDYKAHNTNNKAEHLKYILREAGNLGNKKTYIAFNSIASGGHTPYQYAWGGSGVNPAMNPWLNGYLHDNPQKRYGIVALDFYNNRSTDLNLELVKRIIAANF